MTALCVLAAIGLGTVGAAIFLATVALGWIYPLPRRRP